ncbi:branched-chain amino acid ABC transporter substrate-binding protein [Leeia sp. TBRC 13508]|uniref:Branched-chain amino acid ABC transporter substrate-binding protein n=1 Tax=Leeia speluncae TaxID=2884804 RepID=A0ABS8DAD0_9NEIS|nr:branched-chain amino acid ABC transporter substrate-binding protein [Leeia speluncae]MCB6185160.1 branched-chain amino acid ABC transporter substrate-binding protein [Leeia speluncae]
MRKSIKYFSASAVLSILTPQLFAASAGEVIVKLGQASPLSGSIAHTGKDIESGAKLAVEDLNASGLVIAGKKVKFELISEDDQADPKIATQVAQRLVDAKVAAVIGHTGSGTSIPASRLYSDAGIPQISPSATNPAYTQQGFKTTFRMIANDKQLGSVLGKYVVENLKVKRVAIIDDRTAYGQGLADEFEKSVKSSNGNIVRREYTTNAATDFTAILTSIKANKPDLIFFGGQDAQAGPIAKQMKLLGINAKLIGGDGMQTPELINLAGDAAEGVYASVTGSPREKMPGFSKFESKFKNRFKTEILVFSPYSYDAVHVIADAMKRANSTDNKKFLPFIGKTNLNGVTGNIQFDSIGDPKRGFVTIYQVKNGKWTVVFAKS